MITGKPLFNLPTKFYCTHFTAPVKKTLETEAVPVYNFEVEGAHTYFVGENVGDAVLVHNLCDCYYRSGNNGLDHEIRYCSCACHTSGQTPKPNTQKFKTEYFSPQYFALTYVNPGKWYK